MVSNSSIQVICQIDLFDQVMEERFVVISFLKGFDFLIVFNELIRTSDVKLLKNNDEPVSKIYSLMNSRGWSELNAKDIVKKYLKGEPTMERPC